MGTSGQEFSSRFPGTRLPGSIFPSSDPDLARGKVALAQPETPRFSPVRRDLEVAGPEMQPRGGIVLVDDGEVIALAQLGIDDEDAERAVQPDLRAVRAVGGAFPYLFLAAAGDVDEGDSRGGKACQQPEPQ